MRFHLEIHPSLLSDELKNRLAELPGGLLHLEAGIQSLDQNVLTESGRKGSLTSSLAGLEYLCSLSNLQTHAGLIAGLPSYSLEMLCSDIVRLMKTGVSELQIESLKVLPGTRMRAFGLKYSPLPPYEILQTPSISPSELRTAMQISRMTDLYYNSEAWQGVTRQLVCKDSGFVLDFTKHLSGLMVLDSPVSVERRGVILYEYCRKHYPSLLDEISIAWIQAGLSLKKEPAGNILKIKHLDTFLSENGLQLTVIRGQAQTSHRYYLLTGISRRIIFGYDSQTHFPAPVFMGEVV